MGTMPKESHEMIYSSIYTHYFWIAVLYAAGLFVFMLVYARSQFRPYWKRILVLHVLYCLVAFAVTDGVLIKQEDATQNRIFGYASAYAMVLSKLGHEKITDKTDPNDPVYLQMIQWQKDWEAGNPYIADIYTMKKNSQGQIYLAVDSETDYNRDGVFSEGREQRTQIGELYENGLESLHGAFLGKAAFTAETYVDRWGEWVSAFIPMKTPDGRFDGILGIDFFAETYFHDLNQILSLSFLGFGLLYIGGVIWLVKHHRLRIALHDADNARRVKSEFLANMSHEIRTPLNGIIGISELMDPSNMNGEELEKLHILKTSSQSLLALVNDILDFSALEADKIRLEKVPFNLHDHIASVLSMFTFTAQEKGIFLQFDRPENLSGDVLGDPTRVRQILMNLIGNAVKFTSRGGVTIRVERMALDGPAVRYIVAVEDTGIGIHLEDQKRLFKSFSQADTSTTRKYGGSGLGLAICKSLVELMDGDISVRSSLDHGSTFYFSFVSYAT
jgi:signal transduction histidine kinase